MKSFCASRRLGGEFINSDRDPLLYEREVKNPCVVATRSVAMQKGSCVKARCFSKLGQSSVQKPDFRVRCSLGVLPHHLPSLIPNNMTIEKTLATRGREMAERPYTHPKGRILIKLVLCLFLFVLVLRFNGVFINAVPLNCFLGRRPSSCHHNIPTSSTDDFQLVSVHRAGVGKNRNQVYQVLNIPPSSVQDTSSPFHHDKLSVSYIPRQTTHLANQSRQHTWDYITQSRIFKQSLRDRGYSLTAPAAEWITHEIPTPNITDKLTVTTLAKVASNAYIKIPDTEDWYDLGKRWNQSNHFGWEENGLRGHVFANKDNSTIIVAMKGTSPPFVGGSDTATNDKINVTPYILVSDIGGQYSVLVLLRSSLLYLVYSVRLLYGRYV